MSETTEKLDGLIADVERKFLITMSRVNCKEHAESEEVKLIQRELTAWQTVKDLMEALEKEIKIAKKEQGGCAVIDRLIPVLGTAEERIRAV